MIEIQHIDGSALFAAEVGSVKLCLEAAVKAKTILRGAYLRGADLYGADLYGANLYGADLREADLREADLGGADLYGANLYGANLSEADLREANLREADLREASLRGANLYGADLRGANLRGANLIDAGQDKRGYRFVAYQHEGDVRIMAGCRDLSLTEVREHWSTAHDDDPSLLAECLGKVALIESVAAARGWLRAKVMEGKTSC